VLLMWIFFSSAILLYAAGCAKAVEDVRQQQEQARGARPPAQPAHSRRHQATANALR
jgi:membrane protein